MSIMWSDMSRVASFIVWPISTYCRGAFSSQGTGRASTMPWIELEGTRPWLRGEDATRPLSGTSSYCKTSPTWKFGAHRRYSLFKKKVSMKSKISDSGSSNSRRTEASLPDRVLESARRNWRWNLRRSHLWRYPSEVIQIPWICDQLLLNRILC